MSHFIHIRSQKFQPLPGEEKELVNEGTYGKALCQYLQKTLKDAGYLDPVYFCEDWGWLVEVKGFPFVVGICIRHAPDQEKNITDYILVDNSLGKKRKWSWKKFGYIDYSYVWDKLEKDLLKIISLDQEIDLVGVLEDYPF